MTTWWSPQPAHPAAPSMLAPPPPVRQAPAPIALYLAVVMSFVFSIIAPFVWAHCRQRVYDIDRGAFDPAYRGAYAGARTITGVVSLVYLVLVVVLVHSTVVADHAYRY